MPGHFLMPQQVKEIAERRALRRAERRDLFAAEVASPLASQEVPSWPRAVATHRTRSPNRLRRCPPDRLTQTS